MFAFQTLHVTLMPCVSVRCCWLCGLLMCVSLADESVLMDLKALLLEAKQKVPPVLQVLQTGDETMLDIGGTLAYQLQTAGSLTFIPNNYH